MNYESITDKEVNKRIKELVRKKKEKEHMKIFEYEYSLKNAEIEKIIEKIEKLCEENIWL